MPTLVLHPRYDEDSQRIWQEAVRRGWDILRLDGYTVPSDDAFKLTMALAESPLVVYGGDLWATHVAGQLGVTLLAPLDDWLLTLPAEFTKRWIIRSTVGEVRDRCGGFPVFVKSLRGKQLASRVYASPDDLPDVGDDVRVLVAEPVKFAFEYRCFVNWQGVRTSAQYADEGEPLTGVLREVSERGIPTYAGIVSVPEFMGPLLAQQRMPMRSDLLRDPVPCVIDVGCIEGRGMAVVEANPAWCSGLYGCDTSAALDVIAASCQRVELTHP